ncbi:HET-domain-containing protein [Lepidopterella palustris CBS 459.81]|uniref:HET-domain-containing protein n=1 Tax=Lepidopterella palustris CBS 459.81 TaxID=1314670 RepID=A0A8E2JH43_9PEZI|nr:HET-domain-containing protein [Lepidopterella palustris CBS 459.81]
MSSHTRPELSVLHSSSGRQSKEPEIKNLVTKICETAQDAIDILDARVFPFVTGNDGDSPRALEATLKLYADLGKDFSRYYELTGQPFAIGDSKSQSELETQLRQLDHGVTETLRLAIKQALVGIPWMPGSFELKYAPMNYHRLCHISDSVRQDSIKSLEDLFERIQSWAIPLRTLPPLSRPATTASGSSGSSVETPESKSFFGNLTNSFHRERYSYTKLHSTYSFRLVKIITARPFVTCEIAAFALNENPPPFQALSYTWGQPGRNVDIWCNDLVFKVSPNLKKALQRLHEYHRVWFRTAMASIHTAMASIDWFWIDQLCINQDDFEERTQQVRLMKAIYQQSQNTVIWVGPDDGTAKLAFRLVTDIYTLALRGKDVISKGDDSSFIEPAGDASPDPSNVIQLPPLKDKKWTCLYQLITRPWFERAWVVQEVVISRGDPIILCGNYECLWPRFQKAIIWLQKNGYGEFHHARLQLIQNVFKLSSSSLHRWELPALLEATRPFRATDSRDKVFSVLGLAGETEKPDQWPSALAPNYARPVGDVYRDVTIYCIKKTRTVSVLNQVQHVNDTGENSGDGYLETFPSWVPRWDKIPVGVSLSAFSVKENSNGWKTLTEKFNDAAGGLPVSLDQYSPQDILRIEGVCVDSVEQCLPTVSPAVDAKKISWESLLAQTILSLWQTCASRLMPSMATEALARTFFITTTAGLTPDQESAHPEPLSHFRKYLLNAAWASPDTAAALKALEATLIDEGESLEEQAYGGDPGRYSRATKVLEHRRLFITSKGRLGLGPAAMMSGDSVCVLFGGKLPFILRPVNDHFRLVGECYLYGYMDGAAVADLRNGKLESEWFSLE